MASKLPIKWKYCNSELTEALTDHGIRFLEPCIDDGRHDFGAITEVLFYDKASLFRLRCARCGRGLYLHPVMS